MARRSRAIPRLTFVPNPTKEQVTEWRAIGLAFRPNQVYYGIHPSQLAVGMKVGLCEHHGRSFPANRVPSSSRFIAGKITMLDLERDLVEITFDNPDGGFGLSITGGIWALGVFLIRNEPQREI